MKKEGLIVESTGDGIVVRVCDGLAENAPIVKTVVFSKDEISEVLGVQPVGTVTVSIPDVEVQPDAQDTKLTGSWGVQGESSDSPQEPLDKEEQYDEEDEQEDDVDEANEAQSEVKPARARTVKKKK